MIGGGGENNGLIFCRKFYKKVEYWKPFGRKRDCHFSKNSVKINCLDKREKG